LCTAPDRDAAGKIARGLVDAHLAACVSLVPSVTSVYRWKGKVETDEEILLVIKTRAELASRVIAEVPGLHPYEVPEVLCLPIEDGYGPYLDWIRSETADSE
jgi:periplasmic divalent cation tolerance protein